LTPPLPPPLRTKRGDYHYHVYDWEGSAAPWELSPAQPKPPYYRLYSLVQDLGGLQKFGAWKGVPNITLTAAGALTSDGRQTLVLSFGKKNHLIRQPAVLVTGGIHAREWAATEMAYLLAEYLIINYSPQQPVTKYQRAIQGLIDTRTIHIIPMVNPDGNWHTVFGDDEVGKPARLWRKNRRPLAADPADWLDVLIGPSGPNEPFLDVREPYADEPSAHYKVPDYDPGKHIPPNLPPLDGYRNRHLPIGQTGVDLNRNFKSAAWGFDCAPDYKNFNPESETYFGTKGGGETETANVQEFAKSLNGLATAIDYHAYGQFILFPEETINNDALDSDYALMGFSLECLIKSEGGQGYSLGTGLTEIGEEATGTTADYMAQKKLARAFTIEVDPAYGKGGNDGFLLPELKIMPLFETNIRGALAAVAGASRKQEKVRAARPRKVISTTAAPFLPWDVYGRGNQLPARDLPSGSADSAQASEG
jgi:hypothetical protein